MQVVDPHIPLRGNLPSEFPREATVAEPVDQPADDGELT